MAACLQLGFDVTGNISIRSADPDNSTLEPNMKCIGSPVAEYGHWRTVWVNTPLKGHEIFFTNGWDHLIDFLHTYYTFQYTLDHTFLFSYLQLWWSYAILSEWAVLYIPSTQYRLYGRRFLQVKRPNQQYQSSEGRSTKDKENNEIQIYVDNNAHTKRYTQNKHSKSPSLQ